MGTLKMVNLQRKLAYLIMSTLIQFKSKVVITTRKTNERAGC